MMEKQLHRLELKTSCSSLLQITLNSPPDTKQRFLCSKNLNNGMLLKRVHFIRDVKGM